MKYSGFQIKCGCHCARCSGPVFLEGYSDAEGVHYCFRDDDYVKTKENTCAARTLEKIRYRQANIDRYAED